MLLGKLLGTYHPFLLADSLFPWRLMWRDGQRRGRNGGQGVCALGLEVLGRKGVGNTREGDEHRVQETGMRCTLSRFELNGLSSASTFNRNSPPVWQ